jgi:hypothetical protein
MGFLARLYERHRELFVAQINALNATEQADSIDLLKRTIPQLPQDCKRMIAGESLLRHAPAVSSSMASIFDPNAGQDQHQQQQQQQRPSLGSPPDDRSTPRRFGGRNMATPADKTPPPRHADPMAAFAATDARNADRFSATKLLETSPDAAHNATTLISASPVAAWRADRALPPEVAALRSAVSTEDKRQALRLAQAALTGNVAVWRDHFLRLLAFPLSFTADPSDHGLRLMSLKLVRNALTVDQLLAQAADQHEAILRAAVSCLDDPFPEVQAEAVSLYREASATFDTAEILRSQVRIAEALLPMNARCLEFVLRELVQPFRRAMDKARQPESSVIAQLPELVEILTAAFGHHSSDIRKTAVLDFVDMYAAMGDALLPRLGHLSHSQLKLISIYIVRSGVTSEPVDIANKMIDNGIIAPRY